MARGVSVIIAGDIEIVPLSDNLGGPLARLAIRGGDGRADVCDLPPLYMDRRDWVSIGIALEWLPAEMKDRPPPRTSARRRIIRPTT